jgi:hypothetical protein
MRTQKYFITEPLEQRLPRGVPGLSMGVDVIKDSFSLSCNWLKPRNSPSSEGQPAHVHQVDEIIGFFGTDFENWKDLGGEVEFWLNGQKHLLTRSCLVYVPAGMPHCPMIVRRVDKPVITFSTGPAPKLARFKELPLDREKSLQFSQADTGKYIFTEPTPRQKKRGSIGLSVSSEVVPDIQFFWQGGWMFPTSNYRAHNSDAPHSHDCDEIIGFFGTNLEDWQDLGGQVELWLDGEKHLLTRSFLIFVPKGMPHCPMVIHSVNRPIFHFTTGLASSYVRMGTQ